jgi:molybdopterin-guanine dinucleotide biosynthesis protein A
MPLPYGAIVLAGGKSTRFGRDKASEPLLGQPLLQHVLGRLEEVVAEFVIVKARGQVLPEFETARPVTVAEDLYPESGPLGGLYTGLQALRAEAALAVACDMPLLQPGLVRELFRLLPGHDVVIPTSDDYAQPLCAVYAKTCAEPIRRRLDAGQFKLMGFFADVRVLEVQPQSWRRFDPEGLSFRNLNRPEDLAEVEALLRDEAARPDPHA